MSPLTQFPNDASQTFKKFYKTKYNKVVQQDDQPLLRISNANKHHFLFAPVSSIGQQVWPTQYSMYKDSHKLKGSYISKYSKDLKCDH